jgi:hypothetical protein
MIRGAISEWSGSSPRHSDQAKDSQLHEKSSGKRQSDHPSPENAGGYITVIDGRDGEFPAVQRSVSRWDGRRQLQEQLNRRIAEISSRVEPLSGKITGFLAQYSRQEMLSITLGLAPVEMECFRMWALVLYQG